jgi:hypothetical protein
LAGTPAGVLDSGTLVPGGVAVLNHRLQDGMPPASVALVARSGTQAPARSLLSVAGSVQCIGYAQTNQAIGKWKQYPEVVEQSDS